MDLTVRYPEIDYGTSARWAPHLEFTMRMNAFSVTPAYLEPYIIRVFTDAKAHLDPVGDAALIAEVDWFIAQEAQHCRQHVRFNRLFQTDRYPEVEALGAAYGEKLEKIRTTRSLMFNLAYSEGFEAGGAVFYRLWFEELGKYRIGANEDALRIWDWHFAEEFEHREVAYKLYMAFANRGNLLHRIWYGYFYRIWGVIALLAGGGETTKRLVSHMLEVERAEMTPAEAEASRVRERTLGKWMTRRTIAGLLKVLSPVYNPVNKPPPIGVAEVLKQFDRGGRYARAARARTEAATA